VPYCEIRETIWLLDGLHGPVDDSLMGLMGQENTACCALFSFSSLYYWRSLNNTYRLGKCLGALKHA
jgi:hypothetical protein